MALSHIALKEKQRGLREGFPIGLSLRVHRSLSWLNRSEMAGGDSDAGFIFLWIAFNAAYSKEISNQYGASERNQFDDYFNRLIKLDRKHLIYDAIWQKFAGPIRLLIDNKYLFHSFWCFHNHQPGHENWEERFQRSRKKLLLAMQNFDTRTVLNTLFERLYVLRNQTLHGGATWNSSVNRDQLRDGRAILGFLVPIFIDLMMDHPNEDWGAPYYPVVD